MRVCKTPSIYRILMLLVCLGAFFPSFALSQNDTSMSREELTSFAEILVEKYRDCWIKKQADCFFDLYADDADIYRNRVVNGREVSRKHYRGVKGIVAGKLSKKNLREGDIRIDFSDVEAFQEAKSIFILFRQSFKSFNKTGKVVYSDEVVKFMVMENVGGNWQSVFEDSVAFRPGEYEGIREEVKQKFLARFKVETDKFQKLEVDTTVPTATPTPIPTARVRQFAFPTPTPTATPMKDVYAIIFRAFHEVNKRPIADVKVDVTTTEHYILDTFYTDEEGVVRIPKKYAEDDTYFSNYIYMYKFGFEIFYLYHYRYRLGVPVPVNLKLVKPLIIEQWHTVKSGETLRSLAEFYYKSEVYWKELLYHNNTIVFNESEIPVGTEIHCPEFQVIKEYRKQKLGILYVDAYDSNSHQVAVKFYGANYTDNFSAQFDIQQLTGRPKNEQFDPARQKLYEVNLVPREE